MIISPQQVAAEVARQGGSPLQAQVAAALVSGVESNGDPTELSGGVGPAQGLFQFEPGTWLGNGGGQYSPTVGGASWQQQISVFLNASAGNNFHDWGPDLLSPANAGDPNSTSNPGYSYSGAPQPGSKVANAIAGLGSGPIASGTQANPGGTATSAPHTTLPGFGGFLQQFNAVLNPTGASLITTITTLGTADIAKVAIMLVSRGLLTVGFMGITYLGFKTLTTKGDSGSSLTILDKYNETRRTTSGRINAETAQSKEERLTPAKNVNEGLVTPERSTSTKSAASAGAATGAATAAESGATAAAEDIAAGVLLV